MGQWVPARLLLLLACMYVLIAEVGSSLSTSYKIVNITKAITYPPQPIIDHTALLLFRYNDYLEDYRAKLLSYMGEWLMCGWVNITTFLIDGVRDPPPYILEHNHANYHFFG